MTPGSEPVTRQRELKLLDNLRAAGADVKMRREILQELGSIASDASVPLLRDELFSNRAYRRVAAIDLLADIGSPSAFEALVSALPRQSSVGISFTVHALLRNDLLTPKILPILLDCLKDRVDDLQPGAKLGLMTAMREMPEPSQVPVLAVLLRDKDRRVRRGAANSLRLLNIGQSRDALEGAADEMTRWEGRFVRRALRKGRVG
jgi:HEAT repeat protein